MDLATVCGKYFHKTGNLENLVISDEINACTIQIEAEYDGKKEPWYLLFKNETHNHPTEIEPFGGASTCLGGAIRDPLSGRSFVFQAMRLTGAADVLEPVDKTLPGKLPQKTITKQAANGYSSYGNQIGLQQQWFLKSMMKATKPKEWKLVSLPEPFL
jgi:phosphoribosylformylglycinamidine synthase